MSTFPQDLRHAARRLRRSPGFAAVAILTLALGIGANTAIFSAVNRVLLSAPPHVRDLGTLASVYTSDYSGPPYGASSYPDVADFATGVPAFSGVAAYTFAPVVLRGEGAAEMVLGEVVTANFFDLLGVRPALGRAFTAEEGEPGAPPVVVLGHGYWQSRFGADAGVVGRTIELGGAVFTVVGVAPERFIGMLPAVAPAFFVPLESAGSLVSVQVEARSDRGLFVLGRLAPGARLAQASAQLDRLATSLQERHPGEWTDVRGERRRVTVLPASRTLVPPQVRGGVLGFAGLLMAVVGAVLLIGCANIANLMLARATARGREIAVRRALGASRGHLVRQLLTESMLLAGIGGIVGLGAAALALRAIAAARLPLPVDVAVDLAPDARVLGFTLLVTLATGVLFGLAPALRATRPALVPALKDGGGSAEVSGRRINLRNVLATGQVAVVVVLLFLAGLLVQSLRQAQNVDPGFRTDGLLLVGLAQAEHGRTPENNALFYQQLRERVQGLPGVDAASYAASVPLSGGGSRRSFSIEAYQPAEDEDMELNSTYAGPDYFRTMGVALRRGRDFTDSDVAGAAAVAVVNEAFVQRYMPGENAVGRRLGRGRGAPMDVEIIGVAANGKYRSLGEEPLPFVWLAADQQGRTFMTLHVHATTDPRALVEPVKRLVAELDPTVAVINTATARQHLGLTLLPQRAGAWLLGLFSALGLGMAALGIYGVMAYAVSRRTREIGIRLALGAEPGNVRAMVIREGMKLTAVGLAIGLLLAATAGRLVRFVLFGVDPFDPATFAAVIAVVGAAALLANWLPARRSTRVDPLTALRTE